MGVGTEPPVSGTPGVEQAELAPLLSATFWVDCLGALVL